MAKVTHKGDTIVMQIPGDELLLAQYPSQPEITIGQPVCALAWQGCSAAHPYWQNWKRRPNRGHVACFSENFLTRRFVDKLTWG